VPFYAASTSQEAGRVSVRLTARLSGTHIALGRTVTISGQVTRPTVASRSGFNSYAGYPPEKGATVRIHTGRGTSRAGRRPR
jgi:hypothetical protein